MHSITKSIVSIPAGEYHAASRSGRYMSSHLLASFRESPLLYHKKVTGEVTDGDSPALALGRAAHCLVCALYVVVPPVLDLGCGDGVLGAGRL